MKLLLSLTTILLSANLFALETKPAGTILSTYCGHENKTFYICIADTEVGGKKVEFITRSALGKAEYFAVVSKETKGKTTKYTGYYQAKVDKYTVARSYELLLETLNSGKITAQVIDNGVKGRAFEANMIFHTQGAGE